MDTLTVYFPAVGGEPTIAATRTLRSSWSGPETLRIIGSDVDPHASARADVDSFFLTSQRDSPGYVDELLTICTEHNVQVVWPNPPEEQLLFHSNQQKFQSLGIHLILGSLPGLEVFSQKQKTYEVAEPLGLEIPKWRWANDWSQLKRACSELDYPDRSIVLRPCVGKGAAGVILLSADVQLAAASLFGSPIGLRVMSLESLEWILRELKVWPDCIACEYLPGREFEVDCFADSGHLLSAVVREHHAMWGGTAAVAEVVDRPDLIDACRTLLAAVEWDNICSVQFKENVFGKPALIEVNPRMASNVALPVEAGNDLPLAALLTALGRPLPEFKPAATGLRIVRYLSQGFLRPGTDGECPSSRIKQEGN